MVAFRFCRGCSPPLSGRCRAVMLDINPPERHARDADLGRSAIGLILGRCWAAGWSSRRVGVGILRQLPFGVLTLALMWALLPATRKTTGGSTCRFF